MRLPSRIGIMSLRSTIAIDCDSFSAGFRRAITSGVKPARPWDWTLCSEIPSQITPKAMATRIEIQTILFRMCMLLREGFAFNLSIERIEILHVQVICAVPFVLDIAHD